MLPFLASRIEAGLIAIVQDLTKLVTTAGPSLPITFEKTPPGWPPPWLVQPRAGRMVVLILQRRE